MKNTAKSVKHAERKVTLERRSEAHGVRDDWDGDWISEWSRRLEERGPLRVRRSGRASARGREL